MFDLEKELLIILNDNLEQEQREQKLFNIAESIGKSYEEIQKQFNEFFEQKLKERIRDYLKSDLTPLERQLKKQNVRNWLKNYFPDPKIIDNVLEYYTAAEETIIISTIKSALKKNKDDSRYLVEELLLRGALYLVAAAPKTGKSLFATDLAVTCCVGDKFLNRKVKANTNVLFIQNEENLHETAFRAYNNGLQNLELENEDLFNNITDTHRFTLVKNVDIIQDISTVIQLIDKFEAKLVIVDSLSASIKKGGLNEHSPELLAGLLIFQQLIQDKNITGLLIHHTNKTDTNEGQTEMIRGIAGRSDISRANDGIIKMAQAKDKKNIDLFFLPRNGQQTKFTVTQEIGEACYWKYKVVSEESLSEENITIQNKILRILKDRYNQWLSETEGKTLPVYGYYLSELENALSLDQDTLIERLNYALQVEGIERTGYKKRHLYHYPTKGESWLDQYLEEEEERLSKQKALLDLDQKRKGVLLSLKTYAEIKEYIKDWTKADEIRIINLMKQDEKDAFYRIVYKQPYSIDEQVILSVDSVETQAKILRISYDIHLKYHKYYLEGHSDYFLASNLRKIN